MNPPLQPLPPLSVKEFTLDVDRFGKRVILSYNTGFVFVLRVGDRVQVAVRLPVSPEKLERRVVKGVVEDIGAEFDPFGVPLIRIRLDSPAATALGSMSVIDARAVQVGRDYNYSVDVLTLGATGQLDT